MISARDITQSPEWFPLEGAGSDHLRLVRLTERTYEAASFLDQRLLASRPEQALCERAVAQAAAAQLTPRSHYIFHTGHVGSTLLSRLIGAHPAYFSLREPALLRLAASAAQSPVSLSELLALLARTWRPEQRAVIKTTSFVSELAEAILGASPDPIAILVFVQPSAYLQTILGGPNSRLEAQALAPQRLRRLARRVDPGAWQAELHTEGEHIAMSWLCEMTTLLQAAERFPQRVLWMDFDTFLEQPAAGLQALFQALGAQPDAAMMATLVAGPLMRQYSKAPEHAYDAALRREILAAAEASFGAEIRRGMLWLERSARQHAVIAAALQCAARARRLI